MEVQPFESSCVPSSKLFITEIGADAFLVVNDAAGMAIVPSAAVVIGAGGAGGSVFGGGGSRWGWGGGGGG